jgi:cytochrome c-type biogenesis protein CcmH
MKRLALTLALLLLTLPASAVLPGEQLADPKLEARARVLSAQLRCMVCQNQTIDDSDSGLAHDLRVLLRERLQAGDTDAQAIAYIHARYGDYVLLKPPFKSSTLLLWLGPLLVLAVGGIGTGLYWRRRDGSPAPLTADEVARLDGLLKEDTT